MRTWWVNQNQTYKQEVGGGYLWSPKTKANGSRNVFYDNMTKVQPGDLVLAFRDTYIKAIGVAESRCVSHPKPDYGAGKNVQWHNDGWKVNVQFFPLHTPMRPREHMDRIAPVLPSRYSPLQPDGNGVQSVYLAEVPEQMEAVLLALIEEARNDLGVFLALSKSYVMVANGNGSAEGLERSVLSVSSDGGFPADEFRRKVLAREGRCRISGIENPQFLKVRHIKPWGASTEIERWDPENGLAFAPNFAALFSRGAIGVDDHGFLVHSRSVAESDFEKLDLPPARRLWLGEFSEQQRRYLAAHRGEVFQR